MPSLFFTNLWMLAGLTALSVPIVIHLLLRRKKKRLRFSTVQFFLRQDEHSSQRRKLRNWLLLTLRLLICTLLVLAFARPYLQDGGAATGVPAKRQVVFVLDRSLSMQADAVDGPKWLRARESLRQMLGELKPGDRAALVGVGARAEVLSEWAPPAAVAQLVKDLQPAFGASQLGQGMQQARRLLALADPSATTQICVLSDLQRSGCQDLAVQPVPQEAAIKTVKVGDLVAPNLAITDLEVEPAEGVRPHATLTSFKEENSPPVTLELLLDGKLLSELVATLPAGTTTNLDLAVPPLSPGWHDVQVRLRQHDGLAWDDARFETLFVPKPARALVVEPRRGKRVFEEESFFVTTALDPAQGTSNAVPSQFTCEKVYVDDLAGRLAGGKTGAPWDLVIVPGLRQLPATLGNAFSEFVQSGGGLLLFAGDALNSHQYNAELSRILPAQIGSPEMASDAQFGWRIGAYQTNTAMFNVFTAPNSGDLSLVRLQKRFALAAHDTNGVLARFEDDVPLVVVRQVGAGRVVFVNTSADTAWNDWPKHKTFVPWLHGMGHLLSALRRSDAAKTPSLTTDADPDMDLGPAAARSLFKLHGPDGKVSDWTADDAGQLHGIVFSRPGVYSLRNATGVEVRRLAVNVPAQESDLSALTAAEFEKQLVRAPETRNLTLASLFGSGSNHRELWRVLLAAAVVLLLVEMVLANRTLA